MSISRIQNPTATLAGSGSSITIAPTGIGNLLVVLAVGWGGTTPAITSITDGGDTFVSAGAKGISGDPNLNTEIWNSLTGSGGKTSVVVNWTGAGSHDVCVIEYHTTLPGFSFDLAAAVSSQTGSSSTATGASITTTG